MIACTFLSTSLTCGRFTSLLRCTSSSSTQMHRDVFIIDNSISTTKFIDSYKQRGKLHFKDHVESKHAVSRSAQFIYENSNYTFNGVSEFSLNLCPAVYHCNDGRPEEETHSVHIYPDNITLYNVSNKSSNIIAALCELLLDDRRICSREVTSKIPLIPASCVVRGDVYDEGAGSIVVAAPSANTTMDTTIKILDALKARWLIGGNRELKILLLSSDFVSHRQGSNLLALPREEAYTSAVLQTNKEVPFYTGYL